MDIESSNLSTQIVKPLYITLRYIKKVTVYKVFMSMCKINLYFESHKC